MKTKNITLAVLRVLTGALFIFVVYMKLKDMDMTVGYFATMGLSATIAWLVSVGELLIGLGMVFGVWTRVAAAGAIIILIGAWYHAQFGWMIGAPLITSIILVIFGGGSCQLTNCTPKGTTGSVNTPSSAPASTPTAAPMQ